MNGYTLRGQIEGLISSPIQKKTHLCNENHFTNKSNKSLCKKSLLHFQASYLPSFENLYFISFRTLNKNLNELSFILCYPILFGFHKFYKYLKISLELIKYFSNLLLGHILFSQFGKFSLYIFSKSGKNFKVFTFIPLFRDYFIKY